MERILSSGTAMTIATATGDAGQLIVAATSLGGLVRLMSRLLSFRAVAFGEVGQGFTRPMDALLGLTHGRDGFKPDGFRETGDPGLFPCLTLGEFFGSARFTGAAFSGAAFTGAATHALRRFQGSLLRPAVHQH